MNPTRWAVTYDSRDAEPTYTCDEHLPQILFDFREGLATLGPNFTVETDSITPPEMDEDLEDVDREMMVCAYCRDAENPPSKPRYFHFEQAALISYKTDEYGNVYQVTVQPLDAPEIPDHIQESDENDLYAEVWERAEAQKVNRWGESIIYVGTTDTRGQLRWSPV